MPITRTIYTEGAVAISGFPFGQRFLSGVSSSSVDIQTPRQDVNSFGVLGSINKVQLEPINASAEVTMYICNHNSGIIPFLIGESTSQSPNYFDISISGLGVVKNALLSSFSIEAAVGSIPTISMVFDGQSGQNLSAGVAPTTPNTGTISLEVPNTITGIMFSGGSTCAQNMNFSWEMPVERVNCLGNPINNSTIFPRFPGTFSLSIDGTQSPFLVTGLNINIYSAAFPKALEVSRSHNMAIGDAAASYNLTQEATALDLSFYENFYHTFYVETLLGENESIEYAIFNVPKGQSVAIWYKIHNLSSSASSLTAEVYAVRKVGDNLLTTLIEDGNLLPDELLEVLEVSPTIFTAEANSYIVVFLESDVTIGDYDYVIDFGVSNL
jgi:hypothetical protein